MNRSSRPASPPASTLPDGDPRALDAVRERVLLGIARTDLPLPGRGRTIRRWSALAAATGEDVVVGRLMEAHDDAAAIAHDLHRPELVQPGQLWGVWAAEPPEPVLTARRTGQGWVLEGTKPWCSGASLCTHALVTARRWDGAGTVLLAVDLSEPGVAPVPGSWHAVGMDRSDSGAVTFSAVPADALGTHAEYLDRPGFWQGGMGVAACWFGGARAVAQPVLERAASDRSGELLRAHAGAIAGELAAGWALLQAAAEAVDADPGNESGQLQARALMVRTRIDRMAATVIERAGRALGPGPLCADADHARRVADLSVYIRQTHAERDEAAIPSALPDSARDWDQLLGIPGAPSTAAGSPAPQGSPRLFRGARGAAATAAELRAYDRLVPDWEAGDPDEHGGWLPRELPALLVLAPHPDDEILGAGALIGAALRHGAEVQVVAVTDGEGSHADDTATGGPHRAAELAEIRSAEAEEALRVLAESLGAADGPADSGSGPGPGSGACSGPGPGSGSDSGPSSVQRRRLRLPDGAVAEHQQELSAAISAALEAMPAGTLLVAPLSTDGHPDHDACGTAAARVAERGGRSLVQYPVWLWHHTAPPGEVTEADVEDGAEVGAENGAGAAPQDGGAATDENAPVPWSRARALPLDAELLRARDRALACFRSQLDPDVSDELGRVPDREPGQPVLTAESLEIILRERQILFPRARLDFAALYRGSADPWSLSSRWYEQRKYDLTLAALPRPRYRRAFEPGCSIGVLTARLAARCDQLIATDIVAEAVKTARSRVPDDHVQIRRADITEWPDGPLDLIVISELAYYLGTEAWATALTRARASLDADGVLLSVHWRRVNAEAERSAEQIRADLRAVPGWVLHHSYDDADMLLDVVGPPGPSVAEAEFLG